MPNPTLTRPSDQAPPSLNVATVFALQPSFDQIDKNHDGVIDREEYNAHEANKHSLTIEAGTGPTVSSKRRGSFSKPPAGPPSSRNQEGWEHDAELRRDNTTLREKVSRLEGQVIGCSTPTTAWLIILTTLRVRHSQVAHYAGKQEIYAAAMADRFVFTSELRACRMEVFFLDEPCSSSLKAEPPRRI